MLREGPCVPVVLPVGRCAPIGRVSRHAASASRGDCIRRLAVTHSSLARKPAVATLPYAWIKRSAKKGGFGLKKLSRSAPSNRIECVRRRGRRLKGLSARRCRRNAATGPSSPEWAAFLRGRFCVAHTRSRASVRIQPLPYLVVSPVSFHGFTHVRPCSRRPAHAHGPSLSTEALRLVRTKVRAGQFDARLASTQGRARM
jgi:hypothetical protein